jgi:hypothetical protein
MGNFMNLRKAAEMALSCLDKAIAYSKNELKQQDEARLALRQALAQPEQGPVGYVTDSGRSVWILKDVDLDDDTPLYAAPPKREWKGLTSDDKHFLLANAWNKEQAFDGFMEAIDRFLEEKNT